MQTVKPSRRGFSLVEILVVVLILALIGGFLFYRYAGRSKPGEKTRTPIGKAKDTVCATNLRNVRQAIATMQAGDEEGRFPETLEQLRLPSELLFCAVGGPAYPYQYDPQTGQARCSYPGHENF
jgi:prepilin-type N-terminal cleavage/methylation domain-containing protein